MSSERWRRAEELFDEILSRPIAERKAILVARCGEDEALLNALESMLESYQEAGDFMRKPILDPAQWPAESGGPNLEDQENAVESADEPLGSDRFIGPYRLIRQLGEGGMSTVCLAERDDQPFRRQVVVKVIRRGLASGEGVRRFQIEQQVLANLVHPAIARLYDAGATAEGLPYLAMEHIEGEPIDRYCDHHQLSVRERLALFLTVCSAVRYAHQNLVVHRDLKPSNILVTADGEAKLLDFGIAKLLEPAQLGVEPDETQGWQRWMTPSYASPEQIRGERIGTTSDVYSLGVLLYELLTGRLPHRLEGRSLREIEELVASTRPTRPSDVVTEAVDTGPRDATTADSLGQARGVTVEQLRRRLAGDLDTIVLKALNDEPERRYSSVARLADDIRRHLEGFPVLARPDGPRYRLGKFLRRNRLATAATALLVLLLCGNLITVQVQSQKVTRERDQLREVISFVKELFKVAGEGEDMTVRQAVERSSVMLDRRLHDRPEVRATLLDVIGTIYLNLWTIEPARAQLQQAVDLRRELFGDDSLAVVESLSSLGVANALAGELDVGERQAREAVSLIRRKVGNRHPELVKSLNNLVTVLCFRSDFEAAEELSREALALALELLPGERVEVASALAYRALVLNETGSTDRAAELYRQALDLLRRYQGEGHPDVASLLNNLALTVQQLGDLNEAASLFSQALHLEQRLFGDESPILALTLNNLASVQAELGDYDQAETNYRDAMAMAERIFGPTHYSAPYIAVGLGSMLIEKGEPKAAEALLRDGLTIWLANGTHEVYVPQAESILGQSLSAQERYGEAEAFLLKSYAELERVQGRQASTTRASLHRLVDLYRDWGQVQKLEEYRARLAELERDR